MKSTQDFSSHEDYKKYLRTYFAGLAMQGLLASNDGRESDIIARHSIELADALLDELEKEG